MSPTTMPSFVAIPPPPTSPPTRSSPPPPPPPAAVELYAQPSDVALVNEVLRPWITSGVVTSAASAGAYVHAADLYAADPERLAARFRPAVSTLDGERAWYFLSPLRCRSPRDRRKVRAVADGAGCWHSEAAPKRVVEDDGGGGGGGRRRRVVGYRQSFSFMRRGAPTGAEGRTGWIMAEFHLHQRDDGGFDDGGKGRKVEGLVLCKMYRSPRNRGALVDDNDVRSGVPVLGKKRRSSVVDDDDDAVTAAAAARLRQRRWHANKSDGGGGAVVIAPPPPRILNNKAAVVDDDEVSGAGKRRSTVVDDDDDFDAVPAAAAAAARLQRGANNNNPDNSDGGGGGAATTTSTVTAPPPLLLKRVEKAAVALAVDEEDLPPRKKMRAAEGGGALAPAPAPAAAQLQYCPQCGFHLAALQAIVTLAKSGLDLAVARGDVGADYSEIATRFRREQLLNTES